jgi:hypothetical protein
MTMALESKPPCDCCETVREYIAGHLDPDAALRRDDDAAKLVGVLEPGTRTPGRAGPPVAGVSLGDLGEYLRQLPARPALAGTDGLPAPVVRAVRDRADGRCEDCDAEPTVLFLLPFADPDPRGPGGVGADDLLALCEDCHRQRHTDPTGDVWDDVEAMEDAWAGYRHAMDKDD